VSEQKKKNTFTLVDLVTKALKNKRIYFYINKWTILSVITATNSSIRYYGKTPQYSTHHSYVLVVHALRVARLGSVAGPVIQATGRSEFEDGLGLGDFVSGFSYHMSVRTRLSDHTKQTKFQSQRPNDVETPVPSI
jgi:hypothetical protein